jgi:hypothetical protein
MRELDPIRRLAPPVEPLAPEAVARIRARALTPRRRRRRPVAALLAPVAVAAGVALVVVLGGGQDREVPAPMGQALHEDRGESPRLLLGGWKVTRVDEWKPGNGEMTFEREGRTLQLNWLPTSDAGPAIGPGKEPGARPELEFGTSDGHRATVWRYKGSNEYTAVWRDGDTTLIARGEMMEGAAGFAGLVQSLRDIGVAEWLRAVPERAVTPPEHADVVDEMLAGLPLPPGLDVDALRSGAATRDRYQLGAQVAGAVACGWLATWAKAKAARDDARVQRAVVALASSRDWAILQEMNAEGDYPEGVWEYADAVAGDGTVMGGKLLTVEESYKAALCS